MNKYLKISALFFVFVASMVVTNTMKAAECSVCNKNGACTIDLRPGQGDGTLCTCKSGSTCSAVGDGCACKEAPKAAPVSNVETNPVVAPVGNTEVTTVTNAPEVTTVTNEDGTVTTTTTSAKTGSATLPLIIVGILVLAGGTFGVVKFMGSKNK